ncbi:hypothetical protein PPACK8108_LOCUS3150 [Phakopsora pachyrhizi]|uniref:DUF7872 domain-containing protein n=1 Tax=Phakopsora pachyrhizi TaxID=170000 RepID=A0AAV0ALA4_PHAPC|nr:hypothetical protein PPACK8108_LOCUS3150 [Phakopsora pachyrhizi]
MLLACYPRLIHASQVFPSGLTAIPSQQSNQAKSSGPPRDPSPTLNATCKIKSLSKETWAALQLDDYLKNYPGGLNLSLTQYASSKGLSNFQCGISEYCNAGQPCYPAPPPDWYIFFSVQQWNLSINIMKSAISFAVSFVKSTMSSLVAALIPDIDTSSLDHFKLDFAVNGAFAMVSNNLFIDIVGFFGRFQDATDDFLNIINNLMGSAFYFISIALPNPKAPEANLRGFDVWTHLSKGLARYETLLVQKLANQTASIQEAGISSKDGIYGQVRKGLFITPIEPIFLPRVQEDINNVTLAVSLVKVLRILNSFVTIGQDNCNYNGKNGAISGSDVLSYCDEQGTMFNIIRVKDGKESRIIRNSMVIEQRYGYSTQLLTNQSWTCQNKYGGFEKFPYTNYTLPRDVLSDCIINLPVCDCRDPTIKKNLEKHGVVKACRKAGLPI